VQVLLGLNQALCGKFRGHYVTAAYALIDTEARTLRYAGAGHPPLVVREQSSGKTRSILENGLFLGFFPGAEYSAIEIPFREGDWLVLYTDGIPEMMDRSEEQFGVERLKLFVEQHHRLGVAAFVDSLLERVSLWSGKAAGEEPDDDVTLLAVNFQGNGKQAEA
jgi:serine phosphatase RsbU (regulator of sigma subunit)